MQLVRDEDDRDARPLEADEHVLELGDALGRQHRRGLVQDQDIGAAPERLDDLDQLLLTQREVARARARVDRRPERGRDLGQPRLAGGGVQSHAAAFTEQQVLEHAEGGHQRRVLIDHADAEAERAARRIDADVTAADADPAGVGLRHPREDAHQRGLARPVLAQQAVHLARADREVDVVVRDDARERLRDADQLDGGGVGPRRRVAVAPIRHRDRFGYFISAVTDFLSGVSGTLILPEMIPLRVCWMSFQTGPGMYFVCNSDTPLLSPSV